MAGEEFVECIPEWHQDPSCFRFHIKNIKRDKSNGPVFQKKKKDFISLIIRKIKGDFFQNDFCTITHKIILKNLSNLKFNDKKYMPIVLIGHSKNFIDYNNFDSLLSKIYSMPKFQFSTFYETYSLIDNEL